MRRPGAECPVDPHVDFWFSIAERYHWTPDQVDALPADFYEALPLMVNGLAMAQEEEQRRAEARAQMQARSQGGGQRHYPGSMAG